MTSKHQAFVSCILYFESAPGVPKLGFIRNLDTFLRGAFSSYEIVLVNDSGQPTSQAEFAGIPDETRSNVVVLDLAYRHGRERAMLAGCDLAVGDFIFEIDYPDPKLPPESLLQVFEFAQQNRVDIVGGTSAFHQPKTSQLFYRTLRFFQAKPAPLQTELVRLVSRRALNRTLADRRKTRYRKLLYSLSGMEYRQVDLGDVRVGVIKEHGYRVSLGLDIIAASSRFGSAAAAWCALTFLVISIGIGIYALGVWLIGFPISEGWTSIMGLLSIGFSGIFAVLSLIARMLSLILDEVQNTEPYGCREIVRLANK